jgi:hypothetical protein
MAQALVGFLRIMTHPLGGEGRSAPEVESGHRAAPPSEGETTPPIAVASREVRGEAAVRKTGRRQLILAGVVTEVCVAFPALSAVEAGYDVFVVTDASGTLNTVTRHAAWLRMQAAGVQLMNWFGMACELHRDWRNDVEGLGTLFSNHIPNYRNLMTSYLAQQK